MTATTDHLVVAASHLAEGVAWCEAHLGVSPGPGGQHPLMGTHNRLLKVASPDFPRAYLEIIAIDSHLAPSRGAGLRRWFDLDDQELQARLLAHGPQLIHFVASVPAIEPASAALGQQGIDTGVALSASRQTTAGLLEWRIAVRDDGKRLFSGLLPTLIEWGSTHPTDAMPDSGVRLRALRATHPEAVALSAAYQCMGLSQATVERGPAALLAELDTPKGRVTLATAP